MEISGPRITTLSHDNLHLHEMNLRSSTEDSVTLEAFRSMTGAASASEMQGPMSPSMILALARIRIRDLDSQIGSIAQQISDVGNRASDLQRGIQDLQSLMQTIERNDWEVIDRDVRVGGRSVEEIRRGLSELGIDLELDGRTDLSKEQLQTAIDQTRSMLSDINSGNEMAMLNLQDLTQQRSSIIQLATNLLNTCHETEKNVIGNLR